MEQNINTQNPITFTRDELEAQGYANPDAHPALEANVATRQAQGSTIEVQDKSTGPETIMVSATDITSGVRLAAERRKVIVDGTTGTVLLDSEAARADRGAETVRGR
jgi:phosphoglycerate dehydrogenase-like enzyme